MFNIIEDNKLILPNGGKVLAIDFILGIVLAETDQDYVTWEFNQTTLICFWGHYFPKWSESDPLTSARIDYQKRINARVSTELRQSA